MALADTTLLERLLGRDALLLLVQTCGGLSIDIPKRTPLRGPLCDLPQGAQEALTRYAGGTVLYVPKCDGALRAQRDSEIRSAYDAGATVKELALRYRLTERWVYEILGRPSHPLAEANGQAALF